ncbi:hypothetical protein QJS10_CPA09g00135 [Acorus calamus]|uniref:Uncharacterized protein n=1 Tax=Acorus calamus TaxID=4465 RepID=A0AAV9E733_ACOCL|nr:hypothetical protein QJS10_CPA09g00135 [Acorus calamus]
MAAVGLQSPTLKLCNQRPRFSLRRRNQTVVVRYSSEETVAETAAEAETAPVGASKKSYSLISSSNVQKALRGVAITNADHYGRLGITRTAPYDEVTVAYLRKCEELSNQGLEEEVLNKERQLLKESYEILSSEVERRLYDWSLARSGNPDRYVWPFEVDITQAPPQVEPPNLKKKSIGFNLNE